MNALRRFTLATLVIVTATTLHAAARTGNWYATLETDGTLDIQLNENHRHNNFGFSVAPADLSGIDAQQIASKQAANVTFQLRRAAGTIDFRGAFAEGSGSGFYTFTPNDAFIRDMQSLGYRDFSTDELFVFTTTNLTADSVRELRSLNLPPARDDLEEVAIFKLTPAYVREIRAEGYPSVSLHDLVQLRVGKIDGPRIREYRSLGFKDLSAGDVAELGIMKVTPEYAREIAAVGYPNLSSSDLTELRVGRVTAATIREYRALGYTNVSASKLAEAGIQKVTPDYIRALAKLGYRDLSLDKLIEMKIFKVTPEFIESLREAGYENVPVDKMIQMRMSGADKIFIKKKSS